MNGERDYLNERIRIVTRQLDDPTAVIERVDRIRLERGRRLLGKLLDETRAGEVLKALEGWRRNLGAALGVV